MTRAKANAATRVAVTNRGAQAFDLILIGAAVDGVPPTRNVAPGETVEDAFDRSHFYFAQLEDLGLLEVG